MIVNLFFFFYKNLLKKEFFLLHNWFVNHLLFVKKSVMQDIKTKIGTISDVRDFSMRSLSLAKYDLSKFQSKLLNYKVFFWDVLDIVQKSGVDLFSSKAKKSWKELFVVFSTNVWFCGRLNSKLFDKVLCDSKKDVDIFCVWKKALNFFSDRWFNVVWYLNSDSIDWIDSMDSLSNFVNSAVADEKYKNIKMYFNVNWNPVGLSLYPFNKLDFEKVLKLMWILVDLSVCNSSEVIMDPELFMSCFVGQLLQYMLYWAFLQNKISELLIRKKMFIVRKNINPAKNFMISLNMERQKLLTQKITEIMSLKMALEECAIV